MASTPSASALSAVLRCRGNIWTRNPPTKRPATSGYSLGLAGGTLRDSPAERNRSNQVSAWEAFLQGERVAVGGGLTVAYKSPQVDGGTLAVLWKSSSPDNGPQHQDQKIIKNDALQANGQISPTALTSSRDNSCCGQKITEDRPD
ncbi:uncharacterized protein AKAME5_000588700 [Lates japonicus]|uniref:Uncharacterized protein n=1 Tax=Lates japonicus TaxID=270547 RepID=A0AAD3MEA2_LATJO|nr:uncharacterized protein AKAME5_000588700 [Lates japonicus]